MSQQWYYHHYNEIIVIYSTVYSHDVSGQETRLARAVQVHAADFLYKREEGLVIASYCILPPYYSGRLAENSRLESSVNLSIYRATAKKQNGAICVYSTVDFMSI